MIAAHYLCMWGRSLKGFAAHRFGAADVSLGTRAYLFCPLALRENMCVAKGSLGQIICKRRYDPPPNWFADEIVKLAQTAGGPRRLHL